MSNGLMFELCDILNWKSQRYLETIFGKIFLAKINENLLRIDWKIGENYALQINMTYTIDQY